VLLLDQRGTGRSTPVNRQTLWRLGDPRAQAEYLGHHRADAIVRDNEYEHDGSRRDGARVLGRLIDLARGEQ
jgi:hypothetical protein